MRLTGLVLALCVALVPGQALAHAKLKASSPAANAKVAAGLKEIELEFAEAIESSLSKFELDDAAGKLVADLPGDKNCVKADCKFEIAPLGAGIYTVKYRVLSEDGHVVDGKIAFTVTAGGA